MPTDAELVESLAVALKGVLSEKDSLQTKAVAGTNTSTLLHQPTGIFAVTGLEPEVISTHITPEGLGAFVPAFAADVDDPRYPFLTGFTATTGSEQNAPCDDAPMGYMKGGTLSAAFARVVRQTQTMEISKLLHRKRGVNTDLRLMGDLLGRGVGFDMTNLSSSDILDLVVQSEMTGVGVQFQRTLSTMTWQGAITNNSAQGGYKEFPGLDNQIATGHVDAESNSAMPAADSDVKDFNYAAVDGIVKDIVEYLSMMEYYLFHKADRTGLNPVTWAVVMRPELWFELSAVWPCRYLTHRCANDAGTNPVVINDNVNVNMRDAMRSGMYIDINGRKYPVITDDGIFEHTNINNANVAAGSYASSVYLVPLRIRGNFPTTYWEYIDYRNVDTQISPMGAGARQVPFWTDNGRFLWVYRDNGYCFDLQSLVEPRMIMRTPQLAGKLQNVLYSPLQHLASPYPDSPYHRDGGVSLRGTSTSYNVWGDFLT